MLRTAVMVARSPNPRLAGIPRAITAV